MCRIHGALSHILATAVYLMVIAGSNVAFTQVEPKTPAGAESEKYAERLRNLLERFPEADANKDGILTLEEADAYRAKRRVELEGSRQQAGKNRPQPNYADVKYGPHERNVFDLWLPEGASSERPVPVVVLFHGGGFIAGDKSSFDPRPYLMQGYAVVSANYRFVDGKEVLAPVPMRDGARVVQFLRFKAKEFGVEPQRIALSGGSAGAVIAMWIGLKDDMADPQSEDPVDRQSTRVSCIVPFSGPTNLDPRWIRENLGGPREVHRSLPLFYGVHDDNYDKLDKQALIKEASPITHVSPDDPPTLLIYGGELGSVPLPEDASQGVLIHHPYFGKVLKESLDKVGVECHFRYGSNRPLPAEIGEFLTSHLKRE